MSACADTPSVIEPRQRRLTPFFGCEFIRRTLLQEVYYRFRRASDGRVAALRIENIIEGKRTDTQTETRFFWNPAKNTFQAVGKPENSFEGVGEPKRPIS